ncbi:MAG: hypothetical protein EA424_01310, partial [Planctomycetaceae bacterium]
QPNAFRIDFLNDLGERDVPTLGIDSHELSGLRDVEGVIIDELFPAELDNPDTFRNSFRVVEDAVINGVTVDNPFIHGLNASLKENLAPGQPAGGSAWGNVGSFLEGFYSPDASAEFAFFSVDIRAIAPGRVEFSASAPDIEQEANHGFETLVFPTVPETPKFVVDPQDINFLQTIDNPLVLNIAGPQTADLAGRSAEDGTWWVGESTGSQFVSSPWGGWPAIVDWQDVVVGDFTGDGQGRADIAGRKDGVWWVARSTEDGLVNEQWTSWSTAVDRGDVMVADVNGDGKDDILGRDQSTGHWWVALSDGSTFTNQRWGRWGTSVDWVDVMVADVTDNGRLDIVGRNAANGDWWVAENTEDGFVNRRWGRWSPTITWLDAKVADVDGDGKTDIVGRSAADGRWWVAKSTGSSFDNVAWGSWATSTTWYDVHAADVDGDGRADLVGRDASGNWTVARSTGTGFVNEPWGSWPTDVVWQDVLVGNFSNRVPDAMHASELPPADHGPVAELSEADLQWIVDAAIPQLAEAIGWDANAHPLESVTFQIADLPGTLLGQTLGTTILIDRNAAGFGWFVDRTPWDNEEYSGLSATGGLLAVPGSPADQRMDLLTVVMHELGHVLGYEHNDTGLMQPTLAPGVRYLWDDLLGDHLLDDGEGESAVDDFFATI